MTIRVKQTDHLMNQALKMPFAKVVKWQSPTTVLLRATPAQMFTLYYIPLILQGSTKKVAKLL